MPWFLILIIVFFIVSRSRRGWHGGMRVNSCSGAAHMRHRRQHTELRAPLPIMHDTRTTRERSKAAAPLSRFEQLKRRYVTGELTDEEYEKEVDALLRTPGGMREI